MEKNKYPFRLNKVNWIFALTIAFLFTIFFLKKDGINVYSIGYVVGSIISFAIIPIGISILVWLIRGKKLNAGTYTFNIVLGLLCFGMLGEVGEMGKQKEESIKKMTNSVSDYKDKINNEENAVEAFEEHSANLNENLLKLISNSSGNEQKVYLKLQEFSSINQKVMINWQKSYDSVLAPRILDYSILNTSEEYTYQSNVLKAYINNSQQYKDHFINRKKLLNQLFVNIPSDNQTLLGVLAGISKKDSIQKPIILPFTDSHISYGNNLLEMVDFLKKSTGKWEYKNDELLFQNTELNQIYLTIIQKIANDESEINQLTEKLIEVM